MSRAGHTTVYRGQVNLSVLRDAANETSTEATRKINAFVTNHITGSTNLGDGVSNARKTITTNMLHTLRIALKTDFTKEKAGTAGLTVDADRLKKYFRDVFSGVNEHEVNNFVDDVLTLFTGDRTTSVLSESFDTDFETVIFQLTGAKADAGTAAVIRNQLTSGVITNAALLGSLTGCCSGMRNFRIQGFTVQNGNFVGMTLKNVAFDTSLDRCQFHGARLTGCQINAGGVRCTFTGATISNGTSFKGTFSYCVFGGKGSTMLHTDFDAELVDCDFSTAVLTSVNFTGSATRTAFNSTLMTGCTFSQKKVATGFFGKKEAPQPYRIIGSFFNRATLSQVDFTDSQLQTSTAVETHFGHGVQFKDVFFLYDSDSNSKKFDVQGATYATSDSIFTSEQIQSLTGYQQIVASSAAKETITGTRIHGAVVLSSVGDGGRRSLREDEASLSVQASRNVSFSSRPPERSAPRSSEVEDAMRRDFTATRIEIRAELAQIVLDIDGKHGSEETSSLLRKSGTTQGNDSGRRESGSGSPRRGTAAASRPEAARSSTESGVARARMNTKEIANSKKRAGFKFMQDKLQKLTSLASCVNNQVGSLDPVTTAKSIAVKANMAHIATAAKSTMLSLEEAKTVTHDTEYLGMVDQINSLIESRISRLEAKSKKVQEALDEYGMIASECDKTCSKAEAGIAEAIKIKDGVTKGYKEQLLHTHDMTELGNQYARRIEELDLKIGKHNSAKRIAEENRDQSGRILQHVTTEFVKEVSDFSLDIAQISEMLVADGDMKHSQVLISAYTVMTDAQNRQAEIERLQYSNHGTNLTTQASERIAVLKFMQSTKLQKALTELSSQQAQTPSDSAEGGGASLQYSLRLSVGGAGERSTRQTVSDHDMLPTSLQSSGAGGNHDSLSVILTDGIQKCMRFFGAEADPIEAMTQSHLREKEQLRGRFEDHIQSLQQRHSMELDRILVEHQQEVSQLGQPIEQATAQMTTAHKQKLSELEGQYNQKLKLVQDQHSSDLVKLRAEFELERKFSFTSDSIIEEVEKTVQGSGGGESSSSKKLSAEEKVSAVTAMLFEKINSAVAMQIGGMLGGTRVGKESVDQVFTAIAAGVDEAMGVADSQLLKNVLNQVKIYLKHYHSHLILVMQQRNELTRKIGEADAKLNKLLVTAKSDALDAETRTDVGTRIDRLTRELNELKLARDSVSQKLERLAKGFTDENEKLLTCINNFSTASTEDRHLTALIVEGIQAREYFLYRQAKDEAKDAATKENPAARATTQFSGSRYVDKALGGIEDVRGRIGAVFAVPTERVAGSSQGLPLPPPPPGKAPPPPPPGKAPPPPPPQGKVPSEDELLEDSSSLAVAGVTATRSVKLAHEMLKNINDELHRLTAPIYASGRTMPTTSQGYITEALRTAKTQFAGDDQSKQSTVVTAPFAKHLSDLRNELDLNKVVLQLLTDKAKKYESMTREGVRIDYSELTLAIEKVTKENSEREADISVITKSDLNATTEVKGFKTYQKTALKQVLHTDEEEIIAQEEAKKHEGQRDYKQIKQTRIMKIKRELASAAKENHVNLVGCQDKYYAQPKDRTLAPFEVPRFTVDGYMNITEMSDLIDAYNSNNLDKMKQFNKDINGFAGFLAATGRADLQNALVKANGAGGSAKNAEKLRIQAQVKCYLDYLSEIAENTGKELAAVTTHEEVEALNVQLKHKQIELPRSKTLEGLKASELKVKSDAIMTQLQTLRENFVGGGDVGKTVAVPTIKRSAPKPTYNIVCGDSTTTDEGIKSTPTALTIIPEYDSQIQENEAKVLKKLTIKFVVQLSSVASSAKMQAAVFEVKEVLFNSRDIASINDYLSQDGTLSVENAVQKLFSANHELATNTLGIPKSTLTACQAK